MKRAILFLVVVICGFNMFAFPSSAENVSATSIKLPLTQFGYTNDVLLEGMNPTFTVFLPLYDKIDWRKSEMVFYIRHSNFMIPNAYIQVNVNDSPVDSYKVADLKRLSDGNLMLRVPLNGVKVDSDNPLFKVELRTNLFDSESYCLDWNTNSLWTLIDKDSYISLQPANDHVRLTMDNFLKGFMDKIIIMIPEKPSKPVSSAYLKLDAFLHRVINKRAVEIQRIDKIMPLKSTRLERIIAIRNDISNIYLDDNKILNIPASQVDYIMSEWYDLLPVNPVEVLHVDEDTPSSVIPLKQLGYSVIKAKGIGDLNTDIGFTVADFGGYPRQLTFTLMGSHLPFEVEKEYHHLLKISLNNHLIKAVHLRNDGKLADLEVTLPTELLQRENTLRITYSYYPESGVCTKGGVFFEGEISEDSYFKVDSYSTDVSRLDFTDLPGRFMGSGAIVLPETNNAEYSSYLSAAASFLSAMKQFDQSNIQANIISLNELGSKTYDYYIFFVSGDKLKELGSLAFTENSTFKIVARNKQKELLNINASQPIGILQIFKYKDRPAVAMNVFGSDKKLINRLSDRLLSMKEFRKLHGNLAFYVNDEIRDYEIGTNFQLIKPETKDWTYYYRSYKSEIFTAIWILSGVIFLLIYLSVARKKKALDSGKSDNHIE
ncbi:hypothetical protein GE107_04795 [Cohnella sp. CFH 77786]|uniref:cellulose biosynthesis cyclic di-GMP-binding regulatory protein BcsB n=1 Tax=Cohnella sp. CFH 77786 TaxID=2662265 RepID=UPI001C60DE69|nr:cellulose biosynthesis cyclic di-GMP-binding regulatory protein BcsB [Cohnella sp. CFH 77786]MBW5445379.1 hypothetical protein [Cohnella sp. CFH 77786]